MYQVDAVKSSKYVVETRVFYYCLDEVHCRILSMLFTHLKSIYTKMFVSRSPRRKRHVYVPLEL